VSWHHPSFWAKARQEQREADSSSAVLSAVRTSVGQFTGFFKLFFKRSGQGFKKLGRILSLEFQSAGFHTFQTCQYSKAVFKY
jgi:hypothetical protein